MSRNNAQGNSSNNVVPGSRRIGRDSKVEVAIVSTTRTALTNRTLEETRWAILSKYIRDDPLIPNPAERRFIVGVSRELIRSDLSRGESSLVRKFFHPTRDLETLIDDKLKEVQESVAGEIALQYAATSRPALQKLPVHYDYRHDPPMPSRPADSAVGDFPIWVV